jgi:hypothetical protein
MFSHHLADPLDRAGVGISLVILCAASTFDAFGFPVLMVCLFTAFHLVGSTEMH